MGEMLHDSKAIRSCPACGAHAHRTQARYCATCGRTLEREDYLPADSLRASYHQQHSQSHAPHPTVRRRANSFAPRQHQSAMFPIQNRNSASTTALAFATYALVPYLGILFCPGALLMGSIGLVTSIFAPHRGGRRASYWSIALGVLILCAQIFLWWILYQVPRWSQQF